MVQLCVLNFTINAIDRTLPTGLIEINYCIFFPTAACLVGDLYST